MEGRRHIVEVRDAGDATALCPAEAILYDRPLLEIRGGLYPATKLDEGQYILKFDGGDLWPVRLRARRSQRPPAMVIRSAIDRPS